MKWPYEQLPICHPVIRIVVRQLSGCHHVDDILLSGIYQAVIRQSKYLGSAIHLSAIQTESIFILPVLQGSLVKDTTMKMSSFGKYFNRWQHRFSRVTCHAVLLLVERYVEKWNCSVMKETKCSQLEFLHLDWNDTISKLQCVCTQPAIRIQAVFKNFTRTNL